MIRIWRLNLLLPDGVAVRGEATHSGNTLEVDLRQPLANLSECREISGSGGANDPVRMEEVAGQVLERLYRLAERLQNSRTDLALGLRHARARLAELPGLVSDDQMRSERRELLRQLRHGTLHAREYQGRLARLREAARKSRPVFDASPWERNANGDRWIRELSRYSSVPPSVVVASLEAARLVWADFFGHAFRSELTELTRWQMVEILDGRKPLVNELPATGCCQCGRTIEASGGRRLLPGAAEIDGPALDEEERRRWICQACAHAVCGACRRVLSIPMGRDIIYEDGHVRHAMIAGIPACGNLECRR